VLSLSHGPVGAAFNGRQTSGLGHIESKAVFWQNGTEKEGDPRNKGAANRMNQNVGHVRRRRQRAMIGTKPVDLVCLPNGDGETEKLAGSVAESPLHEKYLAHTDRQTNTALYLHAS
jgi:hypothetical protein